MRRMRAAVGAAFVGLLIAAPTVSVSAAGTRVPDPIPELIEPGNARVALETVASGLVAPVSTAVAPGQKDTLYVAEQNGKIWAVDIGEGDDDDGDDGRGDTVDDAKRRLFADLGSLGLNLGCFFINYDERGLFGVAFDPAYDRNGLVYTFQSRPPAGEVARPANQCNAAQPDHDNVVTQWRVQRPGRPGATIDPASGREVLRVPHPQFNHNGGALRFGPDGLLYVGIGDGGAADDQGPGHAPGGNGQDLGTLLGKVLRIDPSEATSGPAYEVPPHNPFTTRPGARPEILAYGFRNPYAFSFEPRTGRLLVGDVGQNDLEEIDDVQPGGNYGWPVKEGSFAFDQNGAGSGFVTADSVVGDFVDPIAQYDHCVGPVAPALAGPCPVREGVSVVGGFVSLGRESKELRGHYVFGDYSTDFFRSAGRLLYLDESGEVRELTVDTGLAMSVLGLGQDEQGNLYVLGKSGAVPGNVGITEPTNLTGVVRRLVPVDRDR